MKMALLLSGQGTKISEQVKALWLNNEEAKKIIEAAEAQLQEPITEWLTSDVSQDTWKAQLVTYISSMCMYQLYKQKIGLYPNYVLGHSLGEITALTIAGAFDFKTGLKLVDIRGRAMKQAIEGKDSMGMMALFQGAEKVTALAADWDNVFVANYNSDKQTVIAGTKEAIQTFAKENHLEGVMLGVSGAFHTPYMQEASDSVFEQLADFEYNPSLQTQVISNKYANIYPIQQLREEIASQVVSPVLWKPSIDYAIQKGVQLFVDLSPSGMFVSMLQGVDRVFAFHTEQNISRLCDELKDDIEVNQHYDLYSRALGVIVSTKNNSTDTEAYENIVLSGYNQIKSQIGKEITPGDFNKTISLLELILRTKEVSEEEIIDYCNQLAWKVS